jgi:hypothetical protein
MSLKQALFKTINDKWNKQGNDEYAYLAVVHVHKSMEKAIQNEGEEVPSEFNPNEFNFIEDGNYSEIEIVFEEQDGLIYYEYE